MNKLLLVTTVALGAAFAGTLFADGPKSNASVASKVASATSTPAGWTDDFAAAKKQAAAEGKLLLVDFSGSDWCGWCVKLDKEVFSKKEFLDGAKDKFVLVFIDSPNDPRKLSPLAQKQNKALTESYGVQGFPTVLVMDAEGNSLAKTGYQKGGPAKYLKHLDAIVAEKKPVIELNKKIKTMTPGSEERVKAIHAVLKDLSAKQHVENRALVEEVLAFDKDGSAGMRDSYPFVTIFIPVAEAQQVVFDRANGEMRALYTELSPAERKDPAVGAKIRKTALVNNREGLKEVLNLVKETLKTAPEGDIQNRLKIMEGELTRLLESISEK